MKRDPLIIGTASVIVIAFTLSLLNIFVFPNLFYQVNIYRNTDDAIQLDLLNIAEKININSSYFDSLNRTNISQDYQEIAIVNISYMISNTLLHLSAAYDFEEISPRRMKLDYNGTIQGATNDSTPYTEWIQSIFDSGNNGTYFGYYNSTWDYILSSNFANAGVTSYNADDIVGNLTEIFLDENRKPDFMIYQSIFYTENRGLLNEYKTEFERILFVNVHGDIILFLSNEGNWQVPLLF